MKRFHTLIAIVGASAIAAGIGFWTGVHAQGMLTAKEVYRKPLDSVAGKEIRITDLTIPPGATSPAHRHPGDTFVYVVSGEVQIGLNEDSPVTVKAGEVFHEPPMGLHKSTLNPSKTETTHALAIMVIDSAKQSTVAPGHDEHHDH